MPTRPSGRHHPCPFQEAVALSSPGPVPFTPGFAVEASRVSESRIVTSSPSRFAGRATRRGPPLPYLWWPAGHVERRPLSTLSYVATSETGGLKPAEDARPLLVYSALRSPIRSARFPSSNPAVYVHFRSLVYPALPRRSIGAPVTRSARVDAEETVRILQRPRHCTTGRRSLVESHRQRRWFTNGNQRAMIPPRPRPARALRQAEVLGCSSPRLTSQMC